MVIKQLDKKAHCTLRILSKNAQETDVKEFLEEAMRMVEQGDRNNIDAVLQVSVSANLKLYEMIKRSDKIMCDALKELMKEDFEKKEQETLLNTIRNLMDSMKWTAEQAMAAMKIPDADRGKYMSKL